MTPALHITTRVLPGHRIEITAPELSEGVEVDVFLVVRPGAPARHTEQVNLSELTATLPTGPRSAPTWEEVERRVQEERDAWDD